MTRNTLLPGLVPVLVALTLSVLPAHAQYRGSGAGRDRFLDSTDARRFPPVIIPPNAIAGPRVDGTHVRILEGPGTNPPFDSSVAGLAPQNASSLVGQVPGQATPEVLLSNGFRDPGRLITPASHLVRNPPPPAPPQANQQFIVSFPSRRDSFLAPNLVRDQGGNAAWRTFSNRLEERNAFQR